ncbi:MAG: extracellular solute-binding protein [Propionibacteriaceae bacterium]
MSSRRYRHRLYVALLGMSLTVTACSSLPWKKNTVKKTDETITICVWDEKLKQSYEASLAEFSKKNPDIATRVNYIPWTTYFDQLYYDIKKEQADDIFMLNADQLRNFVDQKNIIEIGSEFSEISPAWLPAAIEQYTISGKLYGIPQTTDGGSVLFYNEDLLTKATLNPADISALAWRPDGTGDTLRNIARRLTIDATGKPATDPEFNASKTKYWGYSAAQDLPGVYGNFLASNGVSIQDEHGSFTFATPEGSQTFSYLADMINKDHSSPPADITNRSGDVMRDQFIQGNIALYQTGIWNLPTIADKTKFPWGIAPIPAGPKGNISISNSTVLAGNSKTEHSANTIKVMQWLGSTASAQHLGKNGYLTAFKGSNESFVDYWKTKNIDTSLIIKSSETSSGRFPSGEKFPLARIEWKASFNDIFLGKSTDILASLKKAQDDANRVIK